MEYRREIDGLRALAVIPVILFHADFQTFSGGFIGVDVFFVISGYLITSIILSDFKTGGFQFINFYERRARRILPSIFLVLFASSLFALFLMRPGDLQDYSESVIAVNLFISNILFWRTSGYFSTVAELNPLIHTWSLAVEEQYYLLFPIFLVITRSLTKKHVLIIIFVLFFASLAVAEWGALNKPTAAFFLLPTRGFELLLGAILAYYVLDYPQNNNSNFKNQLLSIFGLILICVAIAVFDRKTKLPGLFTLVPTVGTALIILYGNGKTIVGRMLSAKIFVSIGLVSYSAYLWHQPILAFSRIAFGFELSKNLMPVLLGLTFALAIISWKFVETPFRNRDIIVRRSFIEFSILCGTLLVLFGVVGVYTNGFLFRYKLEDRNLASINFADEGRYVSKRFSEIMMRKFDDNDRRRKVLIIGDSYAQDLVNALYEAKFQEKNQFSTRYILAGCGNLFMERSKFDGKIDRNCFNEVQGFGFEGLYEDNNLRNLIMTADEIWFASNWQYWQAELIGESVSNIVSFSSKTVRVFGTKSFGKVDIARLLKQTDADRRSSKGVVSMEFLKINEILKKNLPPGAFIDMQDASCGGDQQHCALFDVDGHLLSYDGGHLTFYGAKLVGDRLAEDAFGITNNR
jgi:peptidoglycan/LPS O-acetylase OafA/YrhL